MYNITDFQYMISLYCPGECVNCGIWKYDKKEITKDEIDLELFEKVLQSKALENVQYIQLTGGEVQLSPKYLDVIKLIAKYKKDVFIHTNISGWYPKIHYDVTKESLKYIDKDRFRLDISLDGREENYKKVRLVKNGFNKVMETTQKLKELTDNIRFVFTIYKQNIEDMEWLIDLAKSFGIEYYFEFGREATFLNNKSKIDESIKFNEKEIEYIEAILIKSNFIAREDRLIKWQRAKGLYKGEYLKFKCNMGKESLVMNPNGEIYPCLEMVDLVKMGNIKKFNGDLDKLLNSKRALDVIRDIEDKKCQPCGMLCVHKLES